MIKILIVIEKKKAKRDDFIHKQSETLMQVTVDNYLKIGQKIF